MLPTIKGFCFKENYSKNRSFDYEIYAKKKTHL